MRSCGRTGLSVAVGLLLSVAVLAAACGSDGNTDGAAPVDGESAGGIEVSGLVSNPGTLTPVDLEAMVLSTITAENPEKGATEYTGVLFGDLVTVFGVQSDATVVTLAGSGGSTAEISLANMDAEAMLAFDDDGTYDAVMPGMDGESWVADVVSMEFK